MRYGPQAWYSDLGYLEYLESRAHARLFFPSSSLLFSFLASSLNFTFSFSCIVAFLFYCSLFWPIQPLASSHSLSPTIETNSPTKTVLVSATNVLTQIYSRK
ncbi:hypothetical protein GQ43DRAFT_198226 [Delitschia confertaspora ATCC 74209]|uniref:Uncharacterized protein n=1 Tax=Delitschia confertaspora ATCC 74209 TaxID=1513339 RepID=A0A9P4JRV3_9PLEO|nr:hypothetical protein GQ43DRAFT_198226 [Delitschia confertaspora ATCC 74209]